VQANLGGSRWGYDPILKLFYLAKDVISSCILGAKKDEGELFVIIKSDAASRAVSSFKYYFLHETSQFASLHLLLYECKF